MVEPALTDILFVFALGALALGGFRQGAFIGPMQVIAIVLYLWFTVLSLYFVVHAMGVALLATGIEFYMILLYLMTAYFVYHGQDRAFRMILLMLLIGGVITSMIGLSAYTGIMPNSDIFFRDEFQTRIKSTFKDPNVLGPYLVLSVLLCFWLVVSEPRWRVFAAIAGALTLGCLIVTFSRGALVHVVVSVFCFFFALLCLRKTSLFTVLGFVAFSLTTLVLIVIFQDEILSRVSNSYFGSRLQLQNYDDSRFSHIVESLGHIATHPLGIGPNQVRFVFGYEPHNTFVVFALNNGILASVGFALLFFGAMVRCIQKTLRQEAGWIKYAFILSVLLGLTFLINVVGAVHWRHLYVVMGLAYGTYRENKFF